MSALANHAFAKMNGIGNEIVVVDHARFARQRRDGRTTRARWRPPAGVPYDQLHGAADAAARRHRGLHPHLQQ